MLAIAAAESATPPREDRRGAWAARRHARSGVAVVLIALASSAGVLVLLPSGADAKRSAGKTGGKAKGPSMKVLGFGVNRLFVADGEKVTSEAKCDAMVESDSPIGPPQQVYLSVNLEASHIPKSAPTQFEDSLPEGEEELDETSFTAPEPWGKVVAKGPSLFGAPEETKNVFHQLIVGSSSEAGTNEGPAAEEFDGIYSFTAQVKVHGRTITSTAKVEVDCPQLR